MYIMTIILLQENMLDKIIGILIELELFNATILDGEAPETVAVETLPVFKELARFMQGETVYNKTVICHVPKEKLIEKFIKICKAEGIDFYEENVGWVVTSKCEHFYGIE